MSPSYVPILKAKQGEFDALAELRPTIKDKILPLIDLPRLSFDIFREEAAMPPESHFGPRLSELAACWGAQHELLLDSSGTPESCRASEGQSYLTWIFDRCRDLGLLATPVTDLSRSDEFNSNLRRINETDRRGICVRLNRQDAAMSPSDLDLNIRGIASAAKVSRTETRLILDLGQIAGSDVDDLLIEARKILAALPGLMDYREIVVVASSMPPSLAKIVGYDRVQALPRSEVRLWKALLESHPRRRPIVGDYGVVGPTWREPKKRIRTSPNIRYACEDYWVVLRGQPFHKHPLKYGQYRRLARILSERPEYLGPEYSWGDTYVAQCAGRTVGTGGLQTWVSVGTNHHLTLAARQAERILAAA